MPATVRKRPVLSLFVLAFILGAALELAVPSGLLPTGLLCRHRTRQLGVRVQSRVGRSVVHLILKFPEPLWHGQCSD